MASTKWAAGTRPAVERGLPLRVVDALIEVSGLDEQEITLDSSLLSDLGLDDLDIVELAMELGIDDDRLIDAARDVTVQDIVSAAERAAKTRKSA
jgi:acyl carrier protein